MSSIDATVVDSVPLRSSEVADALRRVTPWFQGNLRRVRDPAQPVRRLTWTVCEVATHVAALSRTYRELITGGPAFVLPVARRHEVIADAMRAVPERDLAVLNARITGDLADIADAIDASPDGELGNWYAGTRLALTCLAGLVLGEVLVHGWDIASTTDGDTTLEPNASRLASLAALAPTPLLLNQRGRSAVFNVSFRILGHGSTTLRFDKGDAEIVVDSPNRADVSFSADADRLLLWSYGRSGQLRPFLNRSVRLGGRRPWLILRIPQWFERP